jgi:hypothetical protein
VGAARYTKHSKFPNVGDHHTGRIAGMMTAIDRAAAALRENGDAPTRTEPDFGSIAGFR